MRTCRHADAFGRETVTFVRTFDLPGRFRRSHARTVLATEGDSILDVREETRA